MILKITHWVLQSFGIFFTHHPAPGQDFYFITPMEVVNISNYHLCLELYFDMAYALINKLNSINYQF